ncbi:SPOR domain-containing protein [Thauera sinica]|uniref:SPOR domain-containing protein n=1 Tax=Thauera sinica TaxID=2665146 RepID=A0ABW1AUV8_9RHOO|nr:SPOR domain-containing protein [Thauera sp. K11]ATE59301.1 sporulation protein [Thauera sp. K11]
MSDADNLDIKKRARRRLVGAAALALLAAIVLPMMMDQEPRPASQDIQVSIPDRDADSALSRPIGGAERASADGALAPPPEEQPASGATPDTEPPAKAAVAPAVPPRAEVRAEPKPGQKPEPKAEAKPEPRPAAPAALSAAAAAEAARARAALSGQEPAPRGESYVVQVGAFGDAAKAARISADLKRQGLAAYTEKAGSVTRVRVGPLDGREAADKVAARLKALGYPAAPVPR